MLCVCTNMVCKPTLVACGRGRAWFTLWALKNRNQMRPSNISLWESLTHFQKDHLTLALFKPYRRLIDMLNDDEEATAITFSPGGKHNFKLIFCIPLKSSKILKTSFPSYSAQQVYTWPHRCTRSFASGISSSPSLLQPCFFRIPPQATKLLCIFTRRQGKTKGSHIH